MRAASGLRLLHRTAGFVFSLPPQPLQFSISSSGASHRTTFCEKLAVISDLFSANMVYFQRLDGVLKSRKTPVVMV